MLQILSSWVVLWPPPLIWPLSLLNEPLPHKEFNQKIAAVILENLRPKAYISQFLAILDLKIAIFSFRMPIFSFQLAIFAST